ncbi:hypothetical protein Tco_0532543 [Tanacetum coccineum]
MDEAIQVSCIIDKLLLSWKDFKHALKHNKEKLTLVELGSHLHIEESLRAQDTAAGKEAEWLRNLILEIPLWSKPIAPIFILCDSATTLEKAYSQMYNEKSRHLGVRHRMIHKLITNRVVSIEFVRSQQNFVDHLTKGLDKDLILKSAEGMGLKSNQVVEC